MTNEFFNDPDFPGRPQHPDFWLLSEAALWVDGKSTDTSVVEIVNEYNDCESVVYMARQRLAKMQGIRPDQVQPQLIAVYMDAITIGARAQQRRTN